jgi:phosphoglycerol transferase MdoB-like AlkP superfamily enzyme
VSVSSPSSLSANICYLFHVVVTNYFVTSAVSGGQKLQNMQYVIYYLSSNALYSFILYYCEIRVSESLWRRYQIS